MPLLLLLVACVAAPAPVKDRSMDEIRRQVAKAMKTSVKRIEVRRAEGPEVPGLTVFIARDEGEKGRPGSYAVGVSDGKTVTLDAEAARTLVFKAWGAARPGPADVARIMAALESFPEPTKPILTGADVATVPERWRKHVFLPREGSAADGILYEYWNQSGEDPLWLARVTVKPDGTAELVVRGIGDFKD